MIIFLHSQTAVIIPGNFNIHVAETQSEFFDSPITIHLFLHLASASIKAWKTAQTPTTNSHSTAFFPFKFYSLMH